VTCWVPYPGRLIVAVHSHTNEPITVGATALMVLDALTDRLIGIVTEADVAHAVADGKDVNEVRIHDVMTARPAVITPATSVRDAAKIMTSSHFRHLPVVGDTGLQGVVDINDVCRVLLADG
jgi:CBS domain-containing protein